MNSIDKVLTGLKCMSDPDTPCTTDCPYRKEVDHRVRCFSIIARDAIDVIAKLKKEYEEMSQIAGDAIRLVNETNKQLEKYRRIECLINLYKFISEK